MTDTTDRDDAIGPLQLALIDNRLDGIVRAMMNALLRTARSAVMSVGRDFSCVVLTADDRLLATAESIPVHVFRGPDLMARSMKRLHPGFARGDAFLHNSPYHGNSHAGDWCVIVPVVDDGGVHRFTIVAKAHVADTGNARPTTGMEEVRDLYEEGALFFPCVRVQEDYGDVEDVVRMCRLRIRVPEHWHGDFRAILGAARVGERRLLELLDELGPELLSAYEGAWFDYSESLMAQELRKLPGGTVTVSTKHDPVAGFPDGVPVNATVTVDDVEGRVEVDLRDNLPSQPFGLNLSEATALSASLIGVFSGLEQPVPTNDGSFRRVTIHLKEDSIVGIAPHPRSTSLATTNLAECVASCVARALAELGDGFGLAEAGRTLPASSADISGVDPRPQRGPYVNMLMLQTTNGPASAHADGWLTYWGMGAAGVMLRDSVEIDELKYPMIVHEERLVADSEGAGRHCGAPAARVEYGPIPGATMDVAFFCDGTQVAPRGVRGGGDGALARMLLRRADGTVEELGGSAQVVVREGETIVSICNGAGGYGPPAERDVAAVRRDVAEGWVSRRRARDVYGVVLADDLRVDAAATAARRAELGTEAGA